MKISRSALAAAFIAAITLVTCGTANLAFAQIPDVPIDAAGAANAGARVQSQIGSVGQDQLDAAAQGQADSSAKAQIDNAAKTQPDADARLRAKAVERGKQGLSGDARSSNRSGVDSSVETDAKIDASSRSQNQNSADANAELNTRLNGQADANLSGDRRQSGDSNIDSQTDATADLQSRTGLQFRSNSDGRLVVGNLSNGLATQAGLQSGDEIVAIGEQRVSDADGFWRNLSNARGSTSIHYWRNGRLHQTQLRNVNQYQSYYRGDDQTVAPPPPNYSDSSRGAPQSSSYMAPSPTYYQPRTYYRGGVVRYGRGCR